MSQKPIKPDIHILLDYAFAILLLLAPALYSFRPLPSRLCYIFGIALLLLAALTRAPRTLASLMPMHTHGKLKWVLMAALILVPAFSGAMHLPTPRMFFIMFTLTTLLVHYLTDFGEAEAPEEAD